MKVKYFGTQLNEKGHFLQDLLTIGIDYNRSINVGQFPFDIQSLTKNKPKGFVLKTIIENYKIIAIEGSCADQRGGTCSVFVTTENVNLEQFESYLIVHPFVIKMIELMPFKVDFGVKTTEIKNKTLKEQFNDLVPVEFGGMQEPLLTNVEQVACDFAVVFGKWLHSTKSLNSGVPVDVLLKMFKNQKGL